MSEELEEKTEEKVVEEPIKEEKGLSIASMVLGIVSLVLTLVFNISVPCAILAIVFSVMGRKKGAKGMATAGMILGIITLSLVIIAIIGIIGLSFFVYNEVTEVISNSMICY